MKQHPPESLRAFPPLSRFARAGGRSQCGGAALARLPSLGPRQFHALWVARSAMDH